LVGVVAELREAGWVEAIEAALGLGPDGHQAGPPEDAQVLGNRRLGDAEAAGELADGVGAAPEALDEAPAGGVREGAERLLISHN
jgi:hypothetical protein